MKLGQQLAGGGQQGGRATAMPAGPSIPAKLQPGDMVIPAQVIQHLPDHVKQAVLGGFKHVGLDPAKFYASAPPAAPSAPAAPAMPAQPGMPQ